MADVLLPPSARFAQSKFHYIDSTGFTRGIYSGAIETTAYGGDRFGASLTTIVEGGPSAAAIARRAQLIAWLVSLKGKQNRIWLPDHAYRQRGSFAAAELIANGTFINGTAGWTAANGAGISATDGVLRITLGDAEPSPLALTNAAVTPNTPYVVRAFVRRGKGDLTQPSVQCSDGITSAAVTPAGDGMGVLGIVPSTSPLTVRVFCNTSTGIQAGDFFECLYASASRCALVDGGPNGLKYSDTPGNTLGWSNSNITVAATGEVGPDGFVDTWGLTETTATGLHSTFQGMTVSSAVQDCTFSAYVKSGLRTWCALSMIEGVGGTQVVCYFNLGSSGTPGTTIIGAGWANLRTATEACGGGWFRCSITARKTTSNTTLTGVIYAATADNTSSYAGSTSAVALRTWRANLAASSFPTRATQTVASAAAAVAPAGRAVWIKGLSPSSNGLLRTGDVVQIGTQLCMVMTSLDSNEAGLGYLQVQPPLRIPPADNTPVIITNPMGRFSFVGQYLEWQNDPGIFSSTTVDLEEACDV